MQHATVRTTRKKTRKPPPVAADEQTTIRTTSTHHAVALTGDRTRLVRVVIAPGHDLDAWLTGALDKVVRPSKHPGCLKYVFALDRATRKALPMGKPYPKMEGL